MNKPTKTRVRLSPEVRKQEILDISATIVSEEGVFAVSVERIGKALKISKSTVYSYYPSINDLLRELLQREMKSLRSKQLNAMVGANTFEQLIRDITHVYLEYIDENGLLITRLQAEPSLSSIGGETEFGRDIAVKHFAKILKDTFNIPMSVAMPAVDIIFGLPETAGHCLARKLTDKQTIENLTVTMILSCLEATKDGYDLKFRPLPKMLITQTTTD